MSSVSGDPTLPYTDRVWETVKTDSLTRIQKTMPADKRIPVTEETRKELHELKEPGETYDDLLRGLAQKRRREKLEDRVQELEDADSDELTSLDDV